MLNNLTTKFQEALMQAQQTAGRLGKPEISSLDVLVALLEQDGGILSPILRKASCDPGLLLQAAQREVSHEPTQSGATTQPQMGRDLATVMHAAEDERKKLKDDYLSVEHFMLGALDTQNKVHQLTDTFGLTRDNYLAAMKDVRGNQRVTDDNPEGKYQTLEKYGTDLTARARAGKIDPVIGRDTEIRRVLQILSRRTKNNPVLIGEPGVGKTAIAEGLARRIVNGDVPESMRNKRIVSLNIGSMLAGAKYRGEFEERLKSFLKEVTDSNGEIILFIDELHTIVGAGASEGAVDASNLLKPALARGELRTIGATTLDEYRKYIEKDAALERRFQPVTVEEPSEAEALEILKGLRPYYEKHHRVSIEDSALEAAVQMSVRYINDRFLPDKAIDIIDEAAAKVRLKSYRTATKTDGLENMLKELLEEKEEAIRQADLEKAREIQSRQREVEQEIKKYRAREERKSQKKSLTVTEASVADIVSDWTKVPVQKLTESESKRLAHLEGILHKRVIGQEEAVKAVAQAVKRGRVGLKDPGRPIGSFLFLGPTGVGKTELSKALAEAVFGSEQAMIRIDMSEYMEKHSVSKMIGSPPGYVGYDEGGQLSEKVRRNPYSVILFDEIEKAHPDVFNILLQVLDDGHITDAHGRKVDFKQTIIIMTSNAGAQAIIEPKKLGFMSGDNEKQDYERMKSNVMEEVRRLFKPEFLNRIDEIMVFHTLNKEHIRKIVGLLLKNLEKRCEEQMDIRLKISDSARAYLAEAGFDSKYGARPLRRAIQTKLEDSLVNEILEGRIRKGDTVKVQLHQKQLRFIPVPAEKADKK